MDSLRVWTLAIRPATLPAGAAPVLLGSALAWRHGVWDAYAAALALLASLLVQITSNLANDYFDFIKGADGEDRLGPARASQQGWLEPRVVLRGACLAAALSAAVGIALAMKVGITAVWIGLASILCAFAYTSGPLPLAYVGLGDLFVMIFFGWVATSGTYFVQAGTWHPESFLAGSFLGALATNILVVNNLRDREGDARANKLTLVVRLGRRAGLTEYALLLGVAFALPLLLWWSGVLSRAWLWPLLSAPLGLRAWRAISKLDGRALNPWLGRSAQLELIYTALLSAGLILDA